MEARTKAVRKEAIWMGVKAEAIGKKAFKTRSARRRPGRRQPGRRRFIHKIGDTIHH